MTKDKTQNIQVAIHISEYVKAVLMCEEATLRLSITEESLTNIDSERDNCGVMSPSTNANDIQKANEKILRYIESLSGKQRIITPAQVSKELGMSEEFVEAILIANGFEEE